MTPNANRIKNTGLANPVQFSPNYKLVQVAQKMGVRDLSKMQITTRQLYHAIKLEPSNNSKVYTFFQGVNTTVFPFTNLTENKLQAGEAIAVERAYLTHLMVGKNPAIPGNIVAVNPIEFDLNVRPVLRSDFDLQIDRQTVTKKINVTSWYAPFNKNANFASYVYDAPTATNFSFGQSVYHFDNSFIIIPQIEFTATLTVPPLPNVDNTLLDNYIMLTIEGLGCLFNPKANY